MNYKKLALFLAVFIVFSCKTNPLTGKNTLNFVSNDSLFPLAFTEYDKFVGENRIVRGTPDAKMIDRVGKNIRVAAEKWFRKIGEPNYLKDYRWEYNLVNDPTVNAWCMPGGKIVFYTGILPICQGETGVAIVMGHEVAHALANHGAQRMSAGQLQQYGALAANVGGAAAGLSNQELGYFNQAYGVGTNVLGVLPFSRSHETEADEIGLKLAAIAGYDPNEAWKLWTRMKANSGGQAPPEFLSTHPSNDSRIKNLKKLAPAARAVGREYGVRVFR